jgi:lymphocyte antigen 6 complex protein
VSKRCSTEKECYEEVHGNMAICHYIWYEDWKCAECCQGDRCNYYVTVRPYFPIQKLALS